MTGRILCAGVLCQHLWHHPRMGCLKRLHAGYPNATNAPSAAPNLFGSTVGPIDARCDFCSHSPRGKSSQRWTSKAARPAIISLPATRNTQAQSAQVYMVTPLDVGTGQRIRGGSLRVIGLLLRPQLAVVWLMPGLAGQGWCAFRMCSSNALCTECCVCIGNDSLQTEQRCTPSISNKRGIVFIIASGLTC